MGLKALLASPTYGPVDPECVQATRYAVMVAARNGITWQGDVSADRMTYSGARNLATNWVYDNKGEVDGIMWVDSDMVPERLDILKVIKSAEHNNADIYTGIYHQRRPHYDPCVYEWHETLYNQWRAYQNDQIYKADACGFGFVWTSEKVIRAIKDSEYFGFETGQWFPSVFDGIGKFGEDIGFCNMARLLGFKVYADTSIRVDHMGNGQRVNLKTQQDYEKTVPRHKVELA